MRTVFFSLSAFLLCAGLALAEDAKPTDAQDPIAGEWHILTEFGGQERTSRFVVERGEDQNLGGTYYDSSGSSSKFEEVSFEGGTLKFTRHAGSRVLRFEARIEGNTLKGHHVLGPREIPVTGMRGKEAFEAFMKQRRKANERSDDLEADYDKHKCRVVPRDAFPVLFDPKLLPVDKAEGIRDEEPVIGVVVGDEAKAYPISIMGVHELVNDTCGGQPIAASW